MKEIDVKTLAVLFAWGLLTGCVGRNEVLFMTKSNAGLDIDTKPPTAEVTVSRKEVVIAPTYEGAKTPPVLASFGQKTGWAGGLRGFFSGVNQTFAGGDAAVAMATLFDDPDVPSEETERFDSSLFLENRPETLLNPDGTVRDTATTNGRVRPFVFATDTALGLKVAWSGTAGPYPDTVRAGFNRKEMALAPVYVTPPMTGHENDRVDAYRVKMPAFLATIDSDVEGTIDYAKELAEGGERAESTPSTTAGADEDEPLTRAQQTEGLQASDGSIRSIQYFATGDAATRMTTHRAVREAMIARLDRAAARTEALQQAKTQTDDAIALTTEAGELIEKLEDPNDIRIAAALLRKGDLLSEDVQNQIEVKVVEGSISQSKSLLKKHARAGNRDPKEIKALSQFNSFLKNL